MITKLKNPVKAITSLADESNDGMENLLAMLLAKVAKSHKKSSNNITKSTLENVRKLHQDGQSCVKKSWD